MSNLPAKLINILGIFQYRFLSCKIGSYLSFIFYLETALIKTIVYILNFQCIYGCYVHSAILPTFHRRCYWLLQVCETKLITTILLKFFRILTLSWSTIWTFPTPTTTRCWSPTPWLSGGRRRSGPRRSWCLNSSQCVSKISLIFKLFIFGQFQMVFLVNSPFFKPEHLIMVILR